MTRAALGLILGVLLTEYRWRRRPCRCEFCRRIDEGMRQLANGERVEWHGDDIQPPDPWPLTVAGCQCPPLWHGIIPPLCPVHNPSTPGWTITTSRDTTFRPGATLTFGPDGRQVIR